MKHSSEPNSTGRAPTRSTRKPDMACPTPEMTKNTVINRPSCENDSPNSVANTGNSGGSSRCAKCELAWARPTSPITRASSRRGTVTRASAAAETAEVDMDANGTRL